MYHASDKAQIRFHIPYLLSGCTADEDVSSNEAWDRFRQQSISDALVCLWVQEDPAGAFEFIGTHILTEQSRAVGCIIIRPLPCLPGLYWLRIVHRLPTNTSSTIPEMPSGASMHHGHSGGAGSISGPVGGGGNGGMSNTPNIGGVQGNGGGVGSTTFGPLINGMIATAQALPELIRGAALHAHRQQLPRLDWRRLDAYVRRHQLLEDVSKSYALATPFNEFFKHVFADE
jgi:hypothetical protein